MVPERIASGRDCQPGAGRKHALVVLLLVTVVANRVFRHGLGRQAVRPSRRPSS